MHEQFFYLKDELTAEQEKVTELTELVSTLRREVAKAEEFGLTEKKENRLLKFFIVFVFPNLTFFIAYLVYYPFWYKNWAFIAPSLAFQVFFIGLLGLNVALYKFFFRKES